MNNLRSSLIKARIGNRSLAANSSIVGVTSRVGGVRLSIMQNRAYTSDRPRKGGAGGLKLLTLLGLGGAAGYYYNSTQSFKTKTAPVTETETKSKTAPAAKTEKKNIDYQKVYNDIAEMLDEDPEYDDGSYGPVLFRLAWHCSGTYDKETQTGGSNGATMRFKPEATHSANNGLAIARDLLEKIHQKYPEISYGDLWTLAGVCAVQELGGPTIPWRAGRQDALEASQCTPDGRLPDATKKEDHARDVFHRMGINDREIVALMGGHTLGRCHLDRSGFDGPWQEAPTFFSNEYYKALANRTWIKKNLESGQWQWVDKDNTVVMMLPIELSMYNDKGFKKYYDLYAKDQDVFFKDFAAAFKKLIELGVPFTGDEKVYEFKRTTE